MQGTYATVSISFLKKKIKLIPITSSEYLIT